MTLVQWALVGGLIFLVVIGTIGLIGPRTSTKLNQTADDVANPASLRQRFGS
jgi:hypothetical protein